jgi:hypothetical protein
MTSIHPRSQRRTFRHTAETGANLPRPPRCASMAHARPHPQARQRSASDLARPLCRCPCWPDCRTIRHREHCGAVGVALRLLSGQRAGRATLCYGTSASFEAARVAFEAAWRDFLPKRSEADFQAWRDQEAWTAEKYRRFDRHERMPPDLAGDG